MTTIVDGKLIGMLTLSLEQLQAISDLLHGKAHVRFDSGNTWTALKRIELTSIVDVELATLKVETGLLNNIITC